MAPTTQVAMLATALVAALLVPASAKLEADQLWEPTGFIRVQGKSFVDDNCKEFLPNGWNTWNRPLLDWAIIAAKDSESTEAKKLEEQFAFAREAGFNVMRIFLTPVNEEQAIMTAPGEYVESTLCGFDFILDLAGRYHIKLIFAWVNNWQEHEGPGWWLNPSDPLAANLDEFWTDEQTRRHLYSHMKTIVERTNTINGKVYRDDPAIFGWNLFNEMRCPASQAQNLEQLKDCHRQVYNWVDATATYLKLIDPNHMVTFGQEGFFAVNSTYMYANPSGTPGNVEAGWSAYVGQDFEMQHLPDSIDFLSFHMWPDNWNTWDLQWVETWITAHIKAAETLGKPLILQEFGKRSDKERAAQIRDPYYNTVYQLVEDMHEENAMLKGSLFWYWDYFGITKNSATADMLEADFPASSSVVHSDGSDDSTWSIVAEHSEKSFLLQQRRVKDCARVDTTDEQLQAASIAGRRRRL